VLYSSSVIPRRGKRAIIGLGTVSKQRFKCPCMSLSSKMISLIALCEEPFNNSHAIARQYNPHLMCPLCCGVEQSTTSITFTVLSAYILNNCRVTLSDGFRCNELEESNMYMIPTIVLTNTLEIEVALTCQDLTQFYVKKERFDIELCQKKKVALT
jgi:hypothetical protein